MSKQKYKVAGLVMIPADAYFEIEADNEVEAFRLASLNAATGNKPMINTHSIDEEAFESFVPHSVFAIKEYESDDYLLESGK